MKYRKQSVQKRSPLKRDDGPCEYLGTRIQAKKGYSSSHILELFGGGEGGVSSKTQDMWGPGSESQKCS